MRFGDAGPVMWRAQDWLDLAFSPAHMRGSFSVYRPDLSSVESAAGCEPDPGAAPAPPTLSVIGTLETIAFAKLEFVAATSGSICVLIG
jgi:hypothetical protein